MLWYLNIPALFSLPPRSQVGKAPPHTLPRGLVGKAHPSAPSTAWEIRSVKLLESPPPRHPLRRKPFSLSRAGKALFLLFFRHLFGSLFRALPSELRLLLHRKRQRLFEPRGGTGEERGWEEIGVGLAMKGE